MGTRNDSTNAGTNADTNDSTNAAGTTPEPGTDTATGTDPQARYDRPGYEDKSFGQAVAADQDLADEIDREVDDESEASARFDAESMGSPAIERQRG